MTDLAIGVSMLMYGGPLASILGGLAFVGGVSASLYNAYPFSWEIKK